MPCVCGRASIRPPVRKVHTQIETYTYVRCIRPHTPRPALPCLALPCTCSSVRPYRSRWGAGRQAINTTYRGLQVPIHPAPPQAHTLIDRRPHMLWNGMECDVSTRRRPPSRFEGRLTWPWIHGIVAHAHAGRQTDRQTLRRTYNTGGHTRIHAYIGKQSHTHTVSHTLTQQTHLLAREMR